jgi:hypothetical protein
LQSSLGSKEPGEPPKHRRTKLKKPSKTTAKGKGLRVVKAAQTPNTGRAKSKFLGTCDIELQMQLMFDTKLPSDE